MGPGAADPGPQPQLEFNPAAPGTWAADWSGVEGRTYFLQWSLDLSTWYYAPFIHFGDGVHSRGCAISEHQVMNGGVPSEQHCIVPDGVFRMRGWDSAGQSAIDLTGAAETLIEVYHPSSYDTGAHTFSGQPHSH